MPDDFVKQWNASKSKKAMIKRYRTGGKTLNRWLAELGGL
jgi:hypothetical protein